MASSLIIRPRAKLDLAEIIEHLAPHNVDAAAHFLDTVEAEFAFLADNPRAGSIRSRPPLRLKGLRSWPVHGFRNYLIFYLPRTEGVEIIRILHGARRLNRLLREQ